MNLLPPGLVKAVYLTLAHSLWQGMVLAVLATIILTATRKSAPVRRYNLLMATLALFALAGGITFLHELNNLSGNRVTVIVEEGNAAVLSEIIHQNITRLKHLSFLEETTAFLNQNATVIVWVWLLVIGFRTLQLALGLRGMQQLRKKADYGLASAWQHLVQDTAGRMGISRVVRLAASGLVKVPVAIGYFKPLILIPAGLLASLPPADLEAILAHELAHIQRRDYLANLLQNLVEIIYFFNPAVWWVSSLIRAEREHCCDDAAIAVTSDKKNYLHALVSCQEYYLSAPAYVLSFAGRKNQLLERARRLVHGRESAAGRAEKAMLTFCLVALMVFSAAFFGYARKVPVPPPKPKQVLSWNDPVQPQASFASFGSAAPVCVPGDPGYPAAAVAPLAAENVAEVAIPANEAVVDTPENKHILPAQPAAPRPPKPSNSARHSEAPEPKADASAILAGDLVTDGLVDRHSKKIEYRLSNKSFEVDGVQQPEKIFRKYRNKYVALTGKSGNWKISYVSETNP